MVQRTMRGGEVLRTRVLWERRIEPVPAVIVVGRPTRPVSRGSYTRMRVLEMEATAYCPNSCCGSGNPKRTAIGMRAGPGVVAVDPQVIPLRTVLFIEGYGLAVAGDTGGAIKGLRVDLGFATHAAALKFGRRKVRVHVLGKA
ncbi:MAG: 3D domain-containing protein [Armatimonadetes bacterium]|nr:3D domain-containing protein [Armatimonadota bacterium]